MHIFRMLIQGYEYSYKIENITNFFLNEEGKLYIVFAYGNQNFTSEFDIVKYE